MQRVSLMRCASYASVVQQVGSESLKPSDLIFDNLMFEFDNSTAQRNLELQLVPLHWSEVVLKIYSPCATGCRANSGTAAPCSLSNLLCLHKLACFTVAEKHFYDFASFQWLAGSTITACL